MKSIRIWFKKTDTARYISHLDLSRCMDRAIHKAKLPFWYTEGFNPHVFLTITMPISLGYSGLRESMDVKLLEESMPYEEIIAKLNAGLPRDIKVFEITEPVMRPGAVAYSKYEVFIEAKDCLGLKAQFEELLSQESVLVPKRTKKGERLVDIKPDFASVAFCAGEGGLSFSVVLPSSNNGSVNPKLLLDAYRERYGQELFAQVTRTQCYSEKMEEYR